MTPSILTPPEAGAAGWQRAVEHWRAGARAQSARELFCVLALNPADRDALNLLGLARLGAGLRAPAVQLLRRALRLDPTDATIQANLATLLKGADPVIAERGFRRALAGDPALAEALFGYANLLCPQGRVADGAVLYARAVACRPDFAEAHEAHAHALLLLGRFAEGWAEYEWRWRVPSFPTERHRFRQPLWTGEPPEGRTILVHSEQGLGDTLQFARYLPLLAERGATVVFQLLGSHRPLRRLMGSLSGVERVTVRGDSLPAFDLHVPLLSLPHRLGGDPRHLPPCVPYLEPPGEAVAAWRKRLAGAPGLRVGLVWAGRPEHANDAARSLSLAALAPLLTTPGVSWFSLQKGPAAEAFATLPPGTVTDLAPDLSDFAAAAALIEALDLVITVDTSVCHLAGALGKPVWVLSCFDGCWRWLLNREDTPWYPTMRLFGQARPGEWGPVVERVAGELAALAGGDLSREDRGRLLPPSAAVQEKPGSPPQAPLLGRSRVKLRDSGIDVDRISVLLMCRDSERYLRHLLPAFGALEANYDCAFDYVFLENGSKDDTNLRLREFLGGRKGRLITSHNTQMLDAMPRMERPTRLRNQMIGAVRSLGSDYALLLDTDIYFDERVLADLFALAPTRNNVAMLCAHGMDVVPANGRWATQNHYYDTAAFVSRSGRLHWPHCVFEDCAKCAGRVDPGERIARPPLLRVRSAFGGMALVKARALDDPQVRWRTSVQHGLNMCEHIHFCETLRRATGADIAVACEVPVYRDCTSQGLE